MDDIFSQFGDILVVHLGEVLVDLVVGQTQNRSRGTNLRIRVQLSLNEIYNGVTKRLKLKEN